MPSWFRRKSETQDAAEGSSTPAAATTFEPQPEKARKWFDHARVYAETHNFDGALACYANGIKLDPESMSAHEAMLETAIKYMNSGGKPASGREVRSITDGSAVSKFAAAEFAWMKDFRNASLAVKALEAAVKAEQFEWGNWIAPRVLGFVRNQKKVGKGTLKQLMELFKEVSAWDQAIAAGEAALGLDPADAPLAHELKDLAAQRAMDQGGYEAAAGEQGGFRKFIKDADRQRELIEAEAITTTESVEDRNLQRARAAYEANPTVPDVIGQYAQLLKKRGTPESIKTAFDVYMKGFTDTGEYRFRMLAGDIKIESAARKFRRIDEKLASEPDSAALQEELHKQRQALMELQVEEYTERVRKYPTDRFRKFDLGTVQYELGRYEDAMGQFQSAKEEPKLRVRASHMLGRCFAKEQWHPEAIAEYKEALGSIDVIDQDLELEIRYDLMASLIEHAREERAIDVAKDALEICSGIARKKITYRDIRAKRKVIDQLIRELSGESTADRTHG
jgi:tetratricopeptide (TPR) repeat protein